jgi:hypothetical protein
MSKRIPRDAVLDAVAEALGVVNWGRGNSFAGALEYRQARAAIRAYLRATAVAKKRKERG